MSDFVLHFGENFVKIAPKNNEVIADYIHVCSGFWWIFLETKFKIFLHVTVLKCNFSCFWMILKYSRLFNFLQSSFSKFWTLASSFS